MPTDRRAFQRFNIILIIELILSKRLEQTFFGITNNFSYNGLCMETQCSDFEPGEDLEIRLKHPHSDLTIPVTGRVAWKNKADKFAFMMGIQLDEIDMDTRERMLEVMSSAGNVPVNFFLPEAHSDDDSESGGEERITDEQITGQEEVLTMKPSTDPEDEDFFADAPEEHAEYEDPLLVEQEPAVPAGDTEISMKDDKTEYRDTTHEEPVTPAIHTPDKDTLDRAGRLSMYDTFHYKKEIWGRNKWSFLLISIVAAAIVIYMLPSMFKDRGSEIPAPATDRKGYVNVDEEEIPELQPSDVQSGGPALQEMPRDVIQQTPGETINAEAPAEDVSRSALPQVHTKAEAPAEDVTRPALPPVHTKAVVNKGYYIQVGAWKNAGYAESTLSRLKKHYPDAYIIRENNLHKIRIPDIPDRQKGSKITKDIKKRFNLNSLLVSKK